MRNEGAQIWGFSDLLKTSLFFFFTSVQTIKDLTFSTCIPTGTHFLTSKPHVWMGLSEVISLAFGKVPLRA